MTKTNFEIKARQEKDGAITGKINGFNFSAIVFDEASSYGIDEGRVSKLWIWDETQGTVKHNKWSTYTVLYERGWDVKPKSAADRHMTDALVDYLESLPTTYVWEEIAEGQPTPIKVSLPSGRIIDAVMKIDASGWARIYDPQTGSQYKRLDPIAVWEMLEGEAVAQ